MPSETPFELIVEPAPQHGLRVRLHNQSNQDWSFLNSGAYYPLVIRLLDAQGREVRSGDTTRNRSYSGSIDRTMFITVTGGSSDVLAESRLTDFYEDGRFVLTLGQQFFPDDQYWEKGEVKYQQSGLKPGRYTVRATFRSTIDSYEEHDPPQPPKKVKFPNVWLGTIQSNEVAWDFPGHK